MAKLEPKFQSELIEEIESRIPGSIVMKQDPTFKQGFPDLVIFCKKKWAMLECKRSKTAKHRPNQDYYVNKCNKMSFARFIFPENKEEILNDIENYFKKRH